MLGSSPTSVPYTGLVSISGGNPLKWRVAGLSLKFLFGFSLNQPQKASSQKTGAHEMSLKG